MQKGTRQGGVGLAGGYVFMDHLTPPDHPESDLRFRAVMHGLKNDGLLGDLEPVPIQKAGMDELTRCHSRSYVRLVEEEILVGRPTLSTGDTAVCEQSFDVARHAVGASIAAVDAVVGDGPGRVFCPVRPPGHHAAAALGMGFCIFNNAALAAAHALAVHGLERVLIADWDVHHGNGTQDIFYEDGRVFYFSTHQHPWYPGTGMEKERGAGEGDGANLNVLFPAGAGGKEVIRAFEQTLMPAMEAYQPELVILSSGFDARRDDPLGLLTLEDEDFKTLTRMMVDLADRCAGGRLVSLLEGGYQLEGLASAAAAHVGALFDD